MFKRNIVVHQQQKLGYGTSGGGPGCLGVYNHYLDICTIFAISYPIDNVFCFPTLESDHMFLVFFEISSDGSLLKCGYHFKKRIVREGGEWITYDVEDPKRL